MGNRIKYIKSNATLYHSYSLSPSSPSVRQTMSACQYRKIWTPSHAHLTVYHWTWPAWPHQCTSTHCTARQTQAKIYRCIQLLFFAFYFPCASSNRQCLTGSKIYAFVNLLKYPAYSASNRISRLIKTRGCLAADIQWFDLASLYEK